jgi:SAM-dependent methyltransferase
LKLAAFGAAQGVEMTAATPQMFDYARLRAHRTRASRMALPGADFLVAHAADEICSRLAVTNRTFTRALDLFSLSPALSRKVEEVRPGIEIVRLGEEASRDDLGLEPGSFDLAVSAFGLHWCNDLPGTLVQLRRALKPDGLFMAALPGEGTLAELRSALIETETALSGGAALRIDPFIEVRQAGQLLQRAGFALPVTDAEKLTLRYGAISGLLQDLRAIGATSALKGRQPVLPRLSASELDRLYKARHAGADDRIPASVNIVYLTGWTPHPSQQKPLKPGSAKARLSDVLKPR